MVTICINNCREIAVFEHLSLHQSFSKTESVKHVIGNYSYTNRYHLLEKKLHKLTINNIH